METLVRPPHIEAEDYDRERREYDNITTWLSEVLDGQMRTTFEYDFDGHELYGRDGGALRPIFKTAIQDAEQLAARNSKMSFEVRRRYIEAEELEDMYAMARGELPNTMVVVSDFPPELLDATEDIGGYNAKRKQTMMRVITKGEDGKIRMQSQSLDRSDRRSLEEIYGYFGIKPEAGELLSQRIHIDLPAEEQEFLVDWVTDVYDRSMASQYGGEWYGGRTPSEVLNTYDFVLAQDDLVKAFVSQSAINPEVAESLRYGLAAAIDKRFKNRHQTNPSQAKIYTPDNIHAFSEMWLAGQEAKMAGKTFSGCGLSINATNDQLSSEEQLSELGYGNKSGEDRYGSLTFKCPKKGCLNTRPHGKLIEKCQKCGADVSCK